MLDASATRCPLCDQPLYGWIKLPPLGDPASVGVPTRGDAEARLVDRCERCGVALEHGREIDLAEELRAISTPSPTGELTIECPNRASLQAALSAGGWAALDRVPGHLILSPSALAPLAERNGYRLEGPSFPVFARNQGWMWQTLLNGITFHANFARELRAGRLRPANARGRFSFAADLVATVLAAPLVALLSVPFETVAALLRRGGLMRARARPAVSS